MQGDQHKQHISGQFNAELDAMKNHLLEMGGLVEQQLVQAMDSLLRRDSGQAAAVIAGDREINDMQLRIDEECSRILALRQPAASDLRLVLAVAKSTTDLERIGDEATKIARQAIKLSELPPSASHATEIRQIGRHVGTMLRDALDSFARLDVRKAVEVVIDDDAVDTEYDAAMRSLVALMMEDARNISGVLHEMWALRGLERVGDHATNIAEQVVYLVRGQDVRHMKPAELQDLLQAEEDA
ncbi:MAG: phosphate signaling complex protein PhoU [Pseudomonadota bacterium]